MNEEARVLERLVRLVGRVGSGRGVAALRRLVDGLVEDLGYSGAALWIEEAAGPVLCCSAGDACDPGDAAWPLEVEGRTEGRLGVCGEVEPAARLLTGMLAGRCAHMIHDMRRSQAQRALLEGLSHEMRAPLQSILGHIDLLLAGSFGALSDRQAEAMGKVAAGSEKILAVIRDVLQAARIDAGREQVVRGTVVLAELLAGEVAVARPLAETAGLELTLECAAGLAVESDGAKIARIVTNLLSNAIKYTAQGGVVVRAGRDEEWVFVEVLDTGPGIPEADRERVFEEYVRLDSTAEGTGLGLAIARRLALLLGGRLRLHAAPGRGTRARLELLA